MSRMLFRLDEPRPTHGRGRDHPDGTGERFGRRAEPCRRGDRHRSWSTPGDLSPGMDSSTVLASGWTAGLQFEAWEGSGWYGLRTSGSYATRGDELGNEYRILSADVGVGVRLLQPDPARIVVPYMVFGLGGIRYSGRDGDAPLAGGIPPGNGATTRAVATAALGLDILSAGQFASGWRPPTRWCCCPSAIAPRTMGSPPRTTCTCTPGSRCASASSAGGWSSRRRDRARCPRPSGGWPDPRAHRKRLTGVT